MEKFCTVTNPMNEVTFVAKLGAFTAVRYATANAAGTNVLIAQGNVEEAQRDASGKVKRCDMRLATMSGRKLLSGEMKRPELTEGRDPRNTSLVSDARNKAVARGLPLYFTCNMADAVLWEVSLKSGVPDRELGSFPLAPISKSGEVEAYLEDIEQNWFAFLDEVERHLKAMASAQPAPTAHDVIRLQSAIYAIAAEILPRAERMLLANPKALEALRSESAMTFGYSFALDPRFKAAFRDELEQVLRLSVFVVAQKLILCRVLAQSGLRSATPYTLDPIEIPASTTDPISIKQIIKRAVVQAIRRSKDYETAFLPTPNEQVLFVEPTTSEEINSCQIGKVWIDLDTAINDASWSAISHNLIGFLYEAIVDPEFRHALGQHYTQENVVDLLVTFAVSTANDQVLDPAAGGGSFLRSAYGRKRALGSTHADALAEVWGTELSAFAAELSTVTLATADTTAPSAYPRVMIMDFFDVRPGLKTSLEIPGVRGLLKIPKLFDAVVGNPPYVSYRHQHNQTKVINALSDLPSEMRLPKLSGKSDEYVWFIVHATRFLKEGGRLGFVVSSAILFSDYGVPLIRFLARNYRICAVVDSMVERWFIDADTNTVLLLLERDANPERRANNQIRFVRLRQPLARLTPPPLTSERRDGLEALVELITSANPGDDDPKLTCVCVNQGAEGGLTFAVNQDDSARFFDDEDLE
jgi:hypothetical protein